MQKICAIIVLLGLTAVSSAQTTKPAAAPAYTVLRYNEDYSYLRDASQRSDFFDPIKFIPLSADDSWYASLGGEVRDRYEYFNHNLFGAGDQDRDGYNLLRILADADVHFGPNLRVFVQGISSSEQSNQVPYRPSDVDEANLHQAFVDLKLPLGDGTDLTFRGGRQNLLFGAQRLIGPLDWTNDRRTFDGFRATLSSQGNKLDAFWVAPVMPVKNSFDNDIHDTDFAGLYDTWQVPGAFAKAHTQLEGYGLFLGKNGVTFPSEATGRENRYTVGTRLSANPKPFDVDIEPDYQFGQFNGGEINAYSVAEETGYTFDNLEFTPRAFLGFDDASGDRNAHGGDLDTFNQLFPTGHLFFGYIGAIGRQNIIDIHPGFNLLLVKNQTWVQSLSLRAEYYQYWRQSGQDAVYQTTGGVLRANAPNTSNSIGSEMDFLLNWQVDRHLNCYAGYSHFFAGRFVEQTGASEDIDFLYAAVTYKF